MIVYRSFLFAPGNEQKKAEKALICGADAVVLDLEDAVAVSEKEKARKLASEVIRKPRKCKGFIRVNAVPTGLTRKDLEAAVSPQLDGIVLAKVESPYEIELVDKVISELEKERNIQAGKTELIPYIETAAGLCALKEILTASKRIARAFFGAVDFSVDIGAERTVEGLEMLYARSKLVVVSRAVGIEPPVDAVFTDISNLDGLIAEAKLGRQLGFQGKQVIHPRQVEPVNKIFSPTKKEVEWARKVVKVFEEMERKGNAAIQIDGKFIEYPVVERAKRILEQHKLIESLD